MVMIIGPPLTWQAWQPWRGCRCRRQGQGPGGIWRAAGQAPTSLGSSLSTRRASPAPINDQVAAIVSQSDVVCFLHRHVAQLGPALLGSTLQQVGGWVRADGQGRVGIACCSPGAARWQRLARATLTGGLAEAPSPCCASHAIMRQLGFREGPVVCVPADMAVVDALAAMLDARVPGACRDARAWLPLPPLQLLLLLPLLQGTASLAGALCVPSRRRCCDCIYQSRRPLPRSSPLPTPTPQPWLWWIRTSRAACWATYLSATCAAACPSTLNRWVGWGCRRVGRAVLQCNALATCRSSPHRVPTNPHPCFSPPNPNQMAEPVGEFLQGSGWRDSPRWQPSGGAPASPRCCGVAEEFGIRSPESIPRAPDLAACTLQARSAQGGAVAIREPCCSRTAAARHPHCTLAPPGPLPAQSRFGDVLDLLARRRLHRLFVVDAEGRPAGMLSINDVLRRVVAAAAPEK